MGLNYVENTDSCASGIKIISAPIIYFISGLLVVLVQLFLLGLLKRSRHLASKGDKQASYILVLPIYSLAVLYLALVGIICGLDDMFGFNNRKVEIVVVKWALYRVVSESLAIFLTHNGIGLKPFRRSLCFGISWALISSIIPLIFYFQIGLHGYLISMIVMIMLLDIFYLFMWLAPTNLLPRRPALRSYSKYYVIGLFLYALAHFFLYMKGTLRVSCVTEILLSINDVFEPLILFYAMHRDSQFWQGLASPETVSSNLNEPLLGIHELGRETIGVVGESIAVLETQTVPIIPFGVIQIDTSGFFPGGSARVYKGIYRQEKVAVKILFCIELTPDRVKSFCSEASMLHSLAHTNIVICYGVAVMPPAICLVTEWCHHGSLYDLLHTSEYYIRDSINGRISHLSDPQHNHNNNNNFNTLSNQQPQQTNRGSLNIRMSNSQSNGDTDSINEVTSDGNPFDETSPSHEFSGHHDTLTKSPLTLMNSIDLQRVNSNNPIERNSFTCEIKVVSKKFQTRTTRSSLPSIKLNLFDDKTLTNETYDESTDHWKVNENGFELDLEKHLSETKIPRQQKIQSKKLKSAASVMQSSVMGYGFGDQNIPIEPVLTKTKSSGSVLLSSDVPSPSLPYCLPMDLRLRMIRDCCAGVAFLHSKGLMHCDIKSLNFLVTNDFVVKLSDLGEARPFKGITSKDRAKMPKNINWSAPEILLDNGNPLSELSDVWSLAVVAAEILTGEIPFDSPHCRQMKVETFVDALGNDLRPTLPSRIDDWIRDTINAGWCYEVEKRCSAEVMMKTFQNKISSPPSLHPPFLPPLAPAPAPVHLPGLTHVDENHLFTPI